MMEVLIATIIVFVIVATLVRRSSSAPGHKKSAKEEQAGRERFALISGGFSILAMIIGLVLIVQLISLSMNASHWINGFIGYMMLMGFSMLVALPVFILNITYLVSSNKKQLHKYSSMAIRSHRAIKVATILIGILFSYLIVSYCYTILMINLHR